MRPLVDGSLSNDTGKLLLVISIARLPPGLNGKQGLIRLSFRARNQLRDEWATLIRAATGNLDAAAKRLGGDWSEPARRCEIDYLRESVAAMDWDNLGASFKIPGDALIEAGIIADDGPKIVTAFRPDWARVRKPNDQGVKITIRKLD